MLDKDKQEIVIDLNEIEDLTVASVLEMHQRYIKIALEKEEQLLELINQQINQTSLVWDYIKDLHDHLNIQYPRTYNGKVGMLPPKPVRR